MVNIGKVILPERDREISILTTVGLPGLGIIRKTAEHLLQHILTDIGIVYLIKQKENIFNI